MHIRAAHAADIPLIRELAHRIWWAHYPDIITPEQIDYMLGLMYSADMLERQMHDEGHHFWLAFDDTGEPLGFLAVSRQEAGKYFLHKFYLEASLQRRGYGTSAFQQLLQQYPELRELRLFVNRCNFKSVNFYFKVGFTIEKCMVTPIGNGFVMDDFQMVWLFRR